MIQDMAWTAGDSRALQLPRGCTRRDHGIAFAGLSSLPLVWHVLVLGVVPLVLAVPEIGSARPHPLLVAVQAVIVAASLVTLGACWIRLWRSVRLRGAASPAELRRMGRIALGLSVTTAAVAAASGLAAVLAAGADAFVTWGLAMIEMPFVWAAAGLGSWLLPLARAVDPTTPPASVPTRPAALRPLRIDFGERGPRSPLIAGPAIACIVGGGLWTVLVLVQVDAWPYAGDRAGLLLVELPLGLAPALAALCWLPFLPAAMGPGLRPWQLRAIGLATICLEAVMLVAALVGIAVTHPPVPGVLVPAALTAAGVWLGWRVDRLSRAPVP